MDNGFWAYPLADRRHRIDQHLNALVVAFSPLHQPVHLAPQYRMQPSVPVHRAALADRMVVRWKPRRIFRITVTARLLRFRQASVPPLPDIFAAVAHLKSLPSATTPHSYSPTRYGATAAPKFGLFILMAFEVVGEWSVWDHLVQDYDPAKANFGVVAEHPELEQILISARNFSEIWIIDHSTTTEEAAGHSGGNGGKGGDLLYRWGNPQAYRAGTFADQQLFWQHNPHWIPEGLPGAGNILIFNNGYEYEGRYPDYSSVVEITPPPIPPTFCRAGFPTRNGCPTAIRWWSTAMPA